MLAYKEPVPGRLAPPRSALVLAVLGVAISVVYASVARLPYLSESYVHLAVAAALESWSDCLDPDRVPLRPLQHLTFFALARADAGPAAARVLPFAFHAGAVWLVFDLTRRLGGGAAGAALAAALFALAPNVKGLAWVAAVSSPGRVFFVLAGLSCAVRRLQGGGRAFAAACVTCFAAALAFHQSAVVFPGFVLGTVLLLLPEAPGSGRRGRAPLRVLAWPTLGVLVTLAGAYLAYLAVRPQRYHRVGGLEHLPASGAKALFALLPEVLRHPALEGLRGHGGTAGVVGGAALAVLVVGGATLLLARGGGTGRFVVLACGLDAVLPVLAGYTQRYAYLGSAFVALGLGLAAGRAGASGRARRGLVVLSALLGLAWGADQVRDVLELRRAGATVRALTARAAEERRRAGKGTPVAVVDLPDMAGREGDVPLFNWGFPQAMTARGVSGPWLLLRTVPYRTTSDSRLVDEQEIDRLVRDPAVPVLRYDPTARRLVPVGRAFAPE